MEGGGGSKQPSVPAWPPRQQVPLLIHAPPASCLPVLSVHFSWRVSAAPITAPILNIFVRREKDLFIYFFYKRVRHISLGLMSLLRLRLLLVVFSFSFILFSFLWIFFIFSLCIFFFLFPFIISLVKMFLPHQCYSFDFIYFFCYFLNFFPFFI